MRTRTMLAVIAAIVIVLGTATGVFTAGLHPAQGASTTRTSPARLPNTPVQIGLVFPGRPRQDITWTVPGPSHVPSLTFPKFVKTSLWPVFSCAGGFNINARGGRGEWILTCVWHPGTP